MFTDHKHNNLIWDVLGLTYDQMYQSRLQLEKYGSKIVHIKAYTIPLQMQSHGLSITPVSIEQLRATLWQKSIRTQNAVRDKTEWQSQKHWCKLKVDTNKHEYLNLVFANHGEKDKIYPLTTTRDSNSTKRCSPHLLLRCKNIKSGFALSTYWRHNSAI